MDESFQRLYEKYHQDIFQFLYYLVKDREQAEDLVHEVYIKVLKSYRALKDEAVKKHGYFPLLGMWRLIFSKAKNSPSANNGKI